MKKQLLFGAFLLGSFFTTNAQEIFNVDFSSTEVLTDWSLINADGDGFNWTVDTEGFQQLVDNGFTGGVALSASFDNTQGPLTPDNSLVSQAFTVPAGGATLTYKIGAVDPDFFEEHYAVYVIDAAEYDAILEGLQADPPTATIGDYLALLTTPVIEETLTTVMATSKTVNIEGLDGESVRIVFRHYDVTDVFIIALDDVVVSNGTADTEDFTSNQLSVFPNPTSDIVNITNAVGLNAVQVMDINGRTVKSVNFNNVSEASINISNLTSGVYMMSIASENGTSTQKIIKQ